MKYVINSRKMLNLGIIIAAMNLVACSKGNTITYVVSSDYTGYCVIFLKPNVKMDYVDKIIIKNGFAKSNTKILQDSFAVKYLNSDRTINIVQIGDEDSISNDEVKHVFGLGNGLVGSGCDTSQIQLISFFVGKKSEYLEWTHKYKSELDYLNALDSNWCKVYKSD